MTVFDRRVAEAFVGLVNAGDDEFEPANFLHALTEYCVELLSVDAAGALLLNSGDSGDSPASFAWTGESDELPALMKLQGDEGPAEACCREGRQVRVDDLERASSRWPRFTEAALAAGFGACYALPMRHRAERVGALSLFARAGTTITDHDLAIAQALADVATITLRNEQTLRHQEVVVGQLQGALDSRVVIEQAKGALAERKHIDVDEAFEELRCFARRHNRRLADVARDVLASAPEVSELLTETKLGRSCR